MLRRTFPRWSGPVLRRCTQPERGTLLVAIRQQSRNGTVSVATRPEQARALMSVSAQLENRSAVGTSRRLATSHDGNLTWLLVVLSSSFKFKVMESLLGSLQVDSGILTKRCR